MYRGFNLKLGDVASFSASETARFKNLGAKAIEESASLVQGELTKYLSADGHLDASMIAGDWFPDVKAHVFISHSHGDLDKVRVLAGWLKEKFGIVSFVDSFVWGHMDHLLKKIDDRYCYQSNSETYNYRKRNNSTSHVHAILSMALAKVIDATECVIFLNTPSSIAPRATVESTLSPWIYFELTTLRLIQKKTPMRPQIAVEASDAAKRMAFDSELRVAYPVGPELDHLTELEYADLLAWERRRKSTPEESLDELYKIKN